MISKVSFPNRLNQDIKIKNLSVTFPSAQLLLLLTMETLIIQITQNFGKSTNHDSYFVVEEKRQASIKKGMTSINMSIFEELQIYQDNHAITTPILFLKFQQIPKRVTEGDDSAILVHRATFRETDVYAAQHRVATSYVRSHPLKFT